MQPTNRGGAAPAERQCRYTKCDGLRCRDWALRGHQHCFRHNQYLRALPGSPITVPLLEDEDSLVSVLSQTVRALACGAIPPANGRAILAGCRLLHSMLGRRLETAKLRLKIRRFGLDEQQIFDPEPAYSIPDPSADREPTSTIVEPSGDLHPEPVAPAQSRPEPNPGRVPHICPSLADVGNHNPIPRSAGASEDPAPETEPSPQPRRPSGPRFRDLKKNWDKALLHTENQMADMYFRRYGESREDYRDSLATPFDNLAREELLPTP